MGGIFYTHEEFYRQADHPIIQCLVNYAKKKNKRLAIIPRSKKNSALRVQEEAYFSELLCEECVFLEAKGLYPSYNAVDAAEVVVGVDTTLVYESIARGKKTAIFSIRSNLLGIHGLTYGWPGDFPSEGPFWTNHPDSNAFVRILDYLFEVDDVQWSKDVEATNFSSLMIYNSGNCILKSILEKELGSALITQY
jgi:surface carbohydrate biosynthesis protein